MKGAFSVDRESLPCLLVGDVPASADAVLANGAHASGLPRVSAARAQPRRADAKNLESNTQVAVSTRCTGAAPEISSAPNGSIHGQQQGARAIIRPRFETTRVQHTAGCAADTGRDRQISGSPRRTCPPHPGHVTVLRWRTYHRPRDQGDVEALAAMLEKAAPREPA